MHYHKKQTYQKHYNLSKDTHWLKLVVKGFVNYTHNVNLQFFICKSQACPLLIDQIVQKVSHTSTKNLDLFYKTFYGRNLRFS